MTGRKLRKGLKGTNSKYITRSAALRKLQLNLSDFRKICILKNIYPREPRKKLKGKDKTYYHKKDILHIGHDTLIEKFRDIHSFRKKYKKLVAKREYEQAKKFLATNFPKYTLDHIIKERYPTFITAIQDIDDPLSTLAIFSQLQSTNINGINPEQIEAATELLYQFLFYISYKRCVVEAFISIKGFYIKCKILNEDIVFLLPHSFNCNIDDEKRVDTAILSNFLEFYLSFMRFVNFKLFKLSNLCYPPPINQNLKSFGFGFLAYKIKQLVNETNTCDNNGVIKNDLVSQSTEISENMGNPDTGTNLRKKKKIEGHELLFHVEQDPSLLSLYSGKQILFNGLIFFISREIPLYPLSVIIKGCGGQIVSQLHLDSFKEKMGSVTHYVVDKPIEYFQDKLVSADVDYIQPQWVFDSLNSGILLPTGQYSVGRTLPPHLSPFINDDSNGYIPERREFLNKIIKEISKSSSNLDSSNDQSTPSLHPLPKELHGNTEDNQETVTEIRYPKGQKSRDDLERGKMLLSKKHRRLLNRIEYTRTKKIGDAASLQKKRKNLKKSG